MNSISPFVGVVLTAIPQSILDLHIDYLIEHKDLDWMDIVLLLKEWSLYTSKLEQENKDLCSIVDAYEGNDNDE